MLGLPPGPFRKAISDNLFDRLNLIGSRHKIGGSLRHGALLRRFVLLFHLTGNGRLCLLSGERLGEYVWHTVGTDCRLVELAHYTCHRNG